MGKGSNGGSLYRSASRGPEQSRKWWRVDPKGQTENIQHRRSDKQLEESTKSQKASRGSQDITEDFKVGAPLASRGRPRISLLTLNCAREETSIEAKDKKRFHKMSPSLGDGTQKWKGIVSRNGNFPFALRLTTFGLICNNTN